MSNVAIFTGITPLPFDADVMLGGAKRADLKTVVIIGETEDGEEFSTAALQVRALPGSLTPSPQTTRRAWVSNPSSYFMKILSGS